MTSEKNCKGCRTLISIEKLNHDCCYYTYNENGDCPCTLCVIKAMCDKACDNYDEWTKKFDPVFPS